MLPYAKKLILHAPPWDSPLLCVFVEDCLRDEVVLICVVGEDCERVHDVIDELVVGDGSDDTRGENLLTTWHTDQALAEVIAFAETVQPYGSVQEVRLETSDDGLRADKS